MSQACVSCVQQHGLSVFSSELRTRVSELERNLSNQEKEIHNQASKLQELQTHLNQARKDLAERDRDLAKAGHELSQAVDKHQQLEAKVGQTVSVYFHISSDLLDYMTLPSDLRWSQSDAGA